MDHTGGSKVLPIYREPNMTRPLDINRIGDAAKHIDPVFLETPLLRRTPLDAELGCELLFKIETLNPIRSFKGRGAELFAATELTAGTPVVCASAGNFGQALAYAATRRGHACTVFTGISIMGFLGFTAHPCSRGAKQARLKKHLEHRSVILEPNGVISHEYRLSLGSGGTRGIDHRRRDVPGGDVDQPE
jgi:hypothetical protein